MQFVEMQAPDHFVGAITQNGQAGLADVGVQALGIHLPDHGAAPLGQFGEAVFAGFQFGLVPPERAAVGQEFGGQPSQQDGDGAESGRNGGLGSDDPFPTAGIDV